eukprot:10384454-Ditylum_brightwellii.AAC.1
MELSCLVFSMTKCSLTCGVNKKQWGKNDGKKDNNSHDCSTYIVNNRRQFEHLNFYVYDCNSLQGRGTAKAQDIDMNPTKEVV